MDNTRAIAVSSGMVLAAAAVSGVVYMSAAQARSSPAEAPVPAAYVVVEYVDADGNIIAIDAMTAGAEVDQQPGYTEEYYEGDHGEGDYYESHEEGDDDEGESSGAEGGASGYDDD